MPHALVPPLFSMSDLLASSCLFSRRFAEAWFVMYTSSLTWINDVYKMGRVVGPEGKLVVNVLKVAYLGVVALAFNDDIRIMIYSCSMQVLAEDGPLYITLQTAQRRD